MKQLTVEDAKQIELEILDYIDTKESEKREYRTV
ncbi:phosphorylcholine transferase LicD1 [Streptococcus pneumoniae]|nr:phosphorylcholine transferase LicD1 [Streptococcus pneumoniae]